MGCSGNCSDPTTIRPYLDTSTHTPQRIELVGFSTGWLNRWDLDGAFLLPWAQEVPSSNLGAPTIYFFVFNELCLTLQSERPNLGPTWVQVQASPPFQLPDVVLRVSRANKSRA